MTTTPDNPLPEDGQSPAAEPAEAKPVRRRRTAKAVADEIATDAQMGAAVPAVEADAATEPVKTPRRRRAAAPQAIPEGAVQAPASEPMPEPMAAAGADERQGHTEPAPQQGEVQARGLGEESAEVQGEAVEPGAGDRSPDRNRRRNRRERQRANRAQEEAAGGDPAVRPAESAPLQLRSPEQVAELFTQVMSGAFDSEGSAEEAVALADADAGHEAEVTEGDAAVASPIKRVLAPDADAPKLQKVLGQAGVGSRRDME